MRWAPEKQSLWTSSPDHGPRSLGVVCLARMVMPFPEWVNSLLKERPWVCAADLHGAFARRASASPEHALARGVVEQIRARCYLTCLFITLMDFPTCKHVQKRNLRSRQICAKWPNGVISGECVPASNAAEADEWNVTPSSSVPIAAPTHPCTH